MAVFLLQVELDPVVEAHHLPVVLGFPHKHMLEATGILSGKDRETLCPKMGLLMHACIHPEFKSQDRRGNSKGSTSYKSPLGGKVTVKYK